MLKHEYNKVVTFKNYKFNIKVDLHHSAVRTPGGVVMNLITINDMGVTNYYRTYECTSNDLANTIGVATDNACAWADERESQNKSVEELLLEKLGFE